MIGRLAKVLCLLALAGCAVPMPVPRPAPAPAESGLPTPEIAARNFVTVVERVEPVIERMCLQVRRDRHCDFRIFVDNDPRIPPNAFQTEDENGQPVIVFSIALVALAHNQDELAFILGHESAHHIAGHIAQSRELARAGAIAGAAYARSHGAGRAEMRAAQQLGAEVNSRRFSKDFELQADALGTRIAWAAGYDPILGARYFERIADPGDEFLGTHPPNAARVAIVRRTVALLKAGR
jgi:predicted Zn-dependent protease